MTVSGHRRQQMGSCRERHQLGSQVLIGRCGEGAVSQVRSIHLHVCKDGTACNEDSRGDSRSRFGAQEENLDIAGQLEARGARCTAPASAGCRPRGEAQLRIASRDNSADDRSVRQQSGSRAGALHQISAQRISRGMGIQGKPTPRCDAAEVSVSASAPRGAGWLPRGLDTVCVSRRQGERNRPAAAWIWTSRRKQCDAGSRQNYWTESLSR